MPDAVVDMNEQLEDAALRDLEAGIHLSEHRFTQAVRSMDRRTKCMVRHEAQKLSSKLEALAEGPHTSDHDAAYLMTAARIVLRLAS